LSDIQSTAKSHVINEKRSLIREAVSTVSASFSTQNKRLFEISSEKGASSWLTVLPISEHGYYLHKGSFRDALCLRYGWQPPHLPTTCVCHKSFTVEHSLSCPNGGYTIFRHNNLRDLTSQFLCEVCHDVSTEPLLQPVSGESFPQRSINRDEGARLDIAATNFWERNGQRSFFDIRVFNPLAPTNLNVSLRQCYHSHEREKRRTYDQRVRDIEHGCFSPLVFNTLGGLGPTATVVYKRIAALISEKKKLPYNIVIRWVRCHVSFSLLRSTIMLLRGSRQRIPRIDFSSISVAIAEGRVS
uniref:Uncharacterized protein n=2 Tax=Amphimedon queenslandica TaxID=400682 RepID=A0A1X7SRF4_AMPQE